MVYEVSEINPALIRKRVICRVEINHHVRPMKGLKHLLHAIAVGALSASGRANNKLAIPHLPGLGRPTTRPRNQSALGRRRERRERERESEECSYSEGPAGNKGVELVTQRAELPPLDGERNEGERRRRRKEKRTSPGNDWKRKLKTPSNGLRTRTVDRGEREGKRTDRRTRREQQRESGREAEA